MVVVIDTVGLSEWLLGTLLCTFGGAGSRPKPGQRPMEMRQTCASQ
jgi:hypothetical protein